VSGITLYEPTVALALVARAGTPLAEMGASGSKGQRLAFERQICARLLRHPVAHAIGGIVATHASGRARDSGRCLPAISAWCSGSSMVREFVRRWRGDEN